MKVMEPVNLEESVPPKVSSPFSTEEVVVGSKETATESTGMVPCEYRLSVNVGTDETPETVPSVRSVGPIPRMPS